MKKTFLCAFAFLCMVITFSCRRCNKERSSVTKIDIPKEKQDTLTVKIHRYEKALFELNIKDLKHGLKKIKPEYRIFLEGGNIDDTLNIIKMKKYLTDPQVMDLYDKCKTEFPDVKDLEAKFTKAFRYLHYYFPDKKIPKVYTYVSDLDFEQPIQYVDSVIIIALDMYLGSTCKYYKMLDQPLYMQNRYRKDFILIDCLRAMAKTMIDNSKENKKFIDYIVYEGKVLYFLDAMLPDTPDSLKIYYSPKQMEWCQTNEANIWSFIIDKKLIYSTDPAMIFKMCTDGPFTTIFSKKSPSRVGLWTGWQIVRSYMENNSKITLKEFFQNQDAQDILTKSKYKPKKIS